MRITSRKPWLWALSLLSGFLILLAVWPGSPAASLAASAEAEEPVEVPIIMYHEVNKNNLTKLGVTPATLEKDLKYLRDNGYETISMTQLIQYVKGGAPLPEKPIILTFDDGYYNNYVYAYPLAQKYGDKLVFSIIGKGSQDFSEVKDENLRYGHASWEQIAEMIQSGCVEIQNHTYNMHKITNSRAGCQKKRGESTATYTQAITEDIGKCQELIEQNTGWSPNTFTYPYGRVSEESVEIIKSMGFQATLTYRNGINRITRDPECLFGLRRINRANGSTLEKILTDAAKVKY